MLDISAYTNTIRNEPLGEDVRDSIKYGIKQISRFSLKNNKTSMDSYNDSRPVISDAAYKYLHSIPDANDIML